MKRAVKSASRVKKPVAAAASRALTVAKSAAKKTKAASRGIRGGVSKGARVARYAFGAALGAVALGFAVAKLKTIF